jgi:hypothetical protein
MMQQEIAEKIVDHILDRLESYFEEGTFTTAGISDKFLHELYEDTLKTAANGGKPVNMCPGGCTHPECLSIDYREEPGIRLVPYARCNCCPDAGKKKS